MSRVAVTQAMEAGNKAEMERITNEISNWDLDPDLNQPEETMIALLAKYNIPDSEVDYRRRE